MSDQAVIAEIEAVEARRCKAVIDRDFTALADMLGDDLLYVHSSATAEDKALYLKKMSEGFYVYSAMTSLRRNFRVMGDVVLVDGDIRINVNVKGCIYGCRYAIPHMLRQGGGSLINTTSVNGLVAEPYLAIYATSKGAIVMLSKGIALDYAKQGIRCNALAPGWVDTPINYAHAEMLGGLREVYATIDSFQPIGRPGEPREIANVALFLASDESSFVTGSVLVADGAMTAK